MIQNFITECQKMIDTNEANSTFKSKPLEFRTGKKYHKVIKDGSVFAFIDKNTGDIYKPASYSIPAKHIRGNVNKPDWIKCMTPYGPNYLR